MTDEEIRAYEIQMLPSPTGRDYRDSPKTALTRAQQLIWADHCQNIGRLQEAEFFRREPGAETGAGRRGTGKTIKAKAKAEPNKGGTGDLF